MRLIVVGAGIGGLGAAVGLRRAGHHVVVLERAPRIDPAGAGIALFTNAMGARTPGGSRSGRRAGRTAKRSAILPSGAAP